MRKRIVLIAAVMLAAIACLTAAAETMKLDSPLYLQKDRRWRDCLLNPDHTGGKTIGEAGCALCVLAMAESTRLGEDVPPDEMLQRIEMSGDDLHWPNGYEALARSRKGLLVKQAALILTACLDSGRPALVCLSSDTLGTHWVLVYGFDGLNRDDPQTAHYLIRDPGTKDRVTFNMTKEWFPKIRVIRAYEPDERLREIARKATEE